MTLIFVSLIERGQWIEWKLGREKVEDMPQEATV